MAVQNPAADYRIVGGVVDLLLYYYLGLTFLESYGFVSIISGTTTNLQRHHKFKLGRVRLSMEKNNKT